MVQATKNEMAAKSIERNKTSLKTRIYQYRYFYLMFLPVFIAFLVFNYIPMVGILIAFFDWGLFGVNEFVGFDNFKTLFQSTAFIRAFGNTLYISLLNLVLGMICSVGLALLIDEVRGKHFKKLTQTIIYIPHFLSWVVIASVFSLILSPQDGIVNAFLGLFGVDSIYFLADEHWWTPVFLFIERWKGTGWGTIIFIAALSGVDPSMHEAATIDGATRFQRVLHITLPAIRNTILVVFILELAKVLNLFESVWVLQNAMVLDKADVIQTYVYRIGVENSDYGLSTAAGLFKSVISVVLVLITNKVSKKVTGEGII
ncbi:ABC transporter permease subunit [Clostridium sp. C2-6-12]|uniref:ABC transporter permease n=1 Tax=Clostridium sp. C2-6-12 TaxID=2698832 RepID=UPI001FADB6EB|nr:ABC transporter permease subunit [Clostridium sp. C2-6-12]